MAEPVPGDLSLAEALGAVPGVRVREREPMARHTPLRVGGPADLFAVVPDVTALLEVRRLARRDRARTMLHWPHQDVLVKDGGVRGLVVRPGAGFESLSRPALDAIVLGAAATFASLEGLGPGWWSGLARWPGTPGGLFHGGEQEHLTGMVSQVRWLRGRSVEVHDIAPADPLPTMPDTAVLVDITLRPGLLSSRAMGRVGPAPSGLLFADPPVARGGGRSAGEVLDDARLTGTRLRAWRLAPEAPGRVINLGGGTARDLLMLARGVSARCEQVLGLPLELRLPIVGDDPARLRRALRRTR